MLTAERGATQRGSRAAAYLGFGLVGILPAFFMVLNALFTDSSGVADDALALAVTVVAYSVLGLVAGLVLPASPRADGVSLATPAALIAIAYTLREPHVAVLAGVQVACAFAAAVAAAAVGARFRGR